MKKKQGIFHHYFPNFIQWAYAILDIDLKAQVYSHFNFSKTRMDLIADGILKLLSAKEWL